MCCGLTPTTLTRSQLAGLDPGEGCIRYRNPAAADFTIARPMLTAHHGEPRSGLLNGARHSQPMLNSPRQMNAFAGARYMSFTSGARHGDGMHLAGWAEGMAARGS
jgi:hypothetical protein